MQYKQPTPRYARDASRVQQDRKSVPHYKEEKPTFLQYAVFIVGMTCLVFGEGIANFILYSLGVVI